MILPHGVLFRGNAEAHIRQNLIKQGYIKGIIGLPANLFYGTGIPACVIVIDKNTAESRAKGDAGLFMVDASRGYMKDGNKNRLRSQDIHKIVDVFNSQLDLTGYSRMVKLDEIIDNDYNLNIPRYIDASIDEDQHDLTAHLKGGIPVADIDSLESYWQVLPNLRKTLFSELKHSRNGYRECLVASTEVKAAVLAHPEFITFAEQSLTPFNDWWQAIQLSEINKGDRPKALIHRISEDLLQRYEIAPLLDKYDIYQILMDYWSESLQDDVYAISQDGWQVGAQLRKLVVAKGEKLKEEPDLTINKVKYKAELIPPALIIDRYYNDEQTHIDALQAELDTVSSTIADYVEEHGDEEGLLADATNDKGSFNKSSVSARLKLATDSDEKDALHQLLSYFDTEANAKKSLKEAQEALDLAVFKHYPTLDEAAIKTLLIEDKWHATLQGRIEDEIERITAQLANRIKELDERYAEPLSQIVDEVEMLSQKVQAHLQAMGVA